MLVDYVQGEWVKARERVRQRIIDIIELTNFRSRINLTPTPNVITKLIFKDIVQKSKQMVQGWGGKMYFVYLPPFSRYSTGIEDINREFVLHTVTELEIPILDIHKEVFVPHTVPLSLFPFRSRGHYNAEGYKLVAESISKRLKADGIIPLNSRN